MQIDGHTAKIYYFPMVVPKPAPPPETKSAFTAEDYATWITPRAALELLRGLGDRSDSKVAISNRLQHGLIRAGVSYSSCEGKKTGYAEVAANVWQHALLGNAWDTSSLWTTADIAIFIPTDAIYNVRTLHLFGVRFDPAGIRALIPPDVEPPARSRPRDEPPPPNRELAIEPAPGRLTSESANKGGNPGKLWWDDLWVEMCRRIYAEGLPHNTQAEIERAMMDWAANNGHEMSEQSARTRARKLFRALQAEDKN